MNCDELKALKYNIQCEGMLPSRRTSLLLIDRLLKMNAFAEAAKRHAKFLPTGPHVALDEIDSWADFLAALDTLEES